MNRRQTLLAFAALLAGTIPAPAAGGLLDHKGQPISEDGFGPGLRLIYFGYTHCPDVCPLGLQNMTEALDMLGRAGDIVTPVFVTVDPERDTVALLSRYITMFHPRFIGVTGTTEAVSALAERFKVTYAKVDRGAGKDYLVDHSTSIYLTDPAGRLLGRFSHSLPPAALATKIAERIARLP